MTHRVLLPIVRQISSNLEARRAQIRFAGLPLTRAWQGTARGFHGTGYIPGILRVDGRVAKRRILCIDVKTNIVARQTWSNDDGTYRIDRLDPTREYHLIAVDKLKAFDSWSASFVTPCNE